MCVGVFLFLEAKKLNRSQSRKFDFKVNAKGKRSNGKLSRTIQLVEFFSKNFPSMVSTLTESFHFAFTTIIQNDGRWDAIELVLMIFSFVACIQRKDILHKKKAH